MKIIKYQIVQNTINHGTEENPDIEVVLSPKGRYSDEANLEKNIDIVKTEAYNGEYTIEDDGVSNYPVAPRNIVSGEYITIDNVLYLATENIPNGEPIIVGQNAVKTTVEEQLNELKGE